MYSPKFLYMLVATFCVFITGVLLRISQLLFVSLPLIVYLIFASSGCKKVGLTCERTSLPERMMAGEYADIVMTVHIEGDAPHLVEVADTLSSGDPPYFIACGGDKVAFHCKRIVNRGVLTLGPVRLRVQNFLRTVFYDYTFTEGAKVSIIPRVHSLRVKMTSQRTIPFFGPIPSRRAGIGGEFYALREYLPGDEFRSINWKATARQGKMVSTEFEAERVSEAVIVIDASQYTALGKTKTLLDYELEVAASVARVLLSQGHRVGVFAYSDYFSRVPSGTTRRHFVKLLEIFTAMTPAGFYRMEYVKNYLAAYVRRGSQIVLISPMEDPRAVKIVEDLSLLGYSVLVISPSPESIEWTDIPHNTFTHLARDILQKEREKIFSQLTIFSHAVNWDVFTPLDQILQVVERWSRKRKR